MESRGPIRIFFFFLNVMLTSAFKALVNNPIKESFYGGKKTINILTAFSFFIESDVKIFLK